MANGTLKVSNIQTSSGSGTITLGQSGETITVPSGVTFTNSGTATGFGGANTPNFFAYLNANQTNFNDTSFTKVAYNAELFDTGNGFDTSTGTYTIPETGKYFIALQVRKSAIQTDRFLAEIKENGSTFTKSFEHGGFSTYGAVTGNYIKNYSANTTLEVFLYQQSGATRTMRGGTDAKDSWFYGFKIIE